LLPADAVGDDVQQSPPYGQVIVVAGATTWHHYSQWFP
jgi:hypothetical protein